MKEQMTVTIDKELKDKIEEFSKRTHIKKSVIINLAVNDYFINLEKQGEKEC